jgi:C-terminal processing protease CtpA/Prc
MKGKIIAVVLILISFTMNAQDVGRMFAKQNPDSVRIELKGLFAELSIKHPGFYRYNEKASFDIYIDSTLKTISQPIDELEILRKVKPIVAKIGCLHTGISLSNESEKALDSFPNHLPFTLFFDDNKAIVWKSFSNDSPIKTGDEIIKINGKHIREVFKTLINNIPMDGYNQTGKYRLLQYTFPGWYRNIVEVSEQFQVELSNGQTHTVNGVLKDNIFGYSDIVKEPISFYIVDSIAILKIPSFSNSYLKSKGQQFEKEIKAVFKRLEENSIKKLLIDLRSNTGGTDSNPALLSSYFFEKPYRYWDRIEITEPIAKDISGLKRIFYGKPKYEDGRWLWSDKGLASKEFQYTRLQKPNKTTFKGDVFVLTNGLCMSSCADFVAIMQANKKAIIIGEETGGGYQGNTSGLIPSVQMECGLAVDIPLLKYFNSVPENKNFGRGTTPDIELLPNLNEIVSDNKHMEKVIEVINTGFY